MAAHLGNLEQCTWELLGAAAWLCNIKAVHLGAAENTSWEIENLPGWVKVG
jgi:hypothetical protein